MASGVSERDTKVATRSPPVSPSGLSGPTSSTVPMSMPPEPVTGFCILPRSATMASTSSRTAPPSTAVGAAVFLGQLPIARRVEVEGVDRDPHLAGPDLPAGVEAAGGLRAG
jgi:hypothetical protein